MRDLSPSDKPPVDDDYPSIPRTTMKTFRLAVLLAGISAGLALAVRCEAGDWP